MNKFRAKRLTFKLKGLLKYQLVRKNKQSGMNTFIGAAGNDTLLGGIGDDVLLGYEEEHLNEPDKSRVTLEAEYAPCICFAIGCLACVQALAYPMPSLEQTILIQSRPD